MASPVLLYAHGSLSFFLGDREQVAVPAEQPRSVKDAFESAGVPHPEVSRVLIDGRRGGFSVTVHGGERVDLYPGAVPAPADRFVCDVHLGVLARRLRQLGFDTWYRTHADDDELAAVAVDEERIVLTRDRGLLMRRAIVHGYCPRSDRPREQLREVVRRYGLAGRVAPLSRCTRCNGPVQPAARADVLEDLPPRTRVEHSRFSRCSQCGQIYWPGSHLPALESLVADAVGADRGHDHLTSAHGAAEEPP